MYLKNKFQEKALLFVLLSVFTFIACGAPYENSRSSNTEDSACFLPCHNVVMEKIEMEAKQNTNPFAIVAYEPTYVLPFNYSSKVSPIYRG